VAEPPEAERFLALDSAFDQALDASLDGVERASVLFSGGVDSALVAEGAARRCEIEAVVVAVPGGGDQLAAEEGARMLGLPLRSVPITSREVEAIRDGPEAWPRSLREPALSVQVALRLAVGSTTHVRVLAGQGADELFGGYAHFRGLEEPEADGRRAQDLERLTSLDWPLSCRIAQGLGRDLRSPFLDPAFLATARAIPIPSTPRTGPTKLFLRRWALHRGLPEPICGRPKRALQYGSGVARLMRGRPSAMGRPPRPAEYRAS
jgi:asparagine synthase (glutamine-hydrolysing)